MVRLLEKFDCVPSKSSARQDQNAILSSQLILKLRFQRLMTSYSFHFFSQTLLVLSEIKIKSNLYVLKQRHIQSNVVKFSSPSLDSFSDNKERSIFGGSLHFAVLLLYF